MRDLIRFLKKYSVLILFLLLEVLNIALLTHSGNSRFSVYFSSANAVSASVLETANSVVEFFKLKTTNAVLAQENMRLRNKVTQLQNQLSMSQESRVKKQDSTYVPAENDLEFIAAKVINITTDQQRNYITINKGRRDGVQEDMGVICAEGVVGIVRKVSNKFAVVMPIINTEMHLNGRFASTNYAGPLVWDGVNCHFVYMQEIAQHVRLRKNDDIITSGLTTTFPEGIKIGRLESATVRDGDSYLKIKIRLATDFQRLSYVQVIRNKNQIEQHDLEEKVQDEDKEEQE